MCFCPTDSLLGGFGSQMLRISTRTLTSSELKLDFLVLLLQSGQDFPRRRDSIFFLASVFLIPSTLIDA